MQELVDYADTSMEVDHDSLAFLAASAAAAQEGTVIVYTPQVVKIADLQASTVGSLLQALGKDDGGT
jgi:hypothetical protein